MSEKNQKKLRKNKAMPAGRQGFTLFELLVSISIIAILTAVAVVSFGGLNKKTRDARRTSDLEKVRLALESARQIGNTYPVNLLSLTGPSGALDKVPTDPKGVGYTYAYSVGSSNTTYILCAYMEDVGSTNVGSSNGCASCGVSSCNYKVINP